MAEVTKPTIKCLGGKYHNQEIEVSYPFPRSSYILPGDDEDTLLVYATVEGEQNVVAFFNSVPASEHDERPSKR